MRETRKGSLKKTVNGPMYQHHDVWISLFDQEFIQTISAKYKMDENHVIGKIVEAYIAENSTLEERLDFFNNVTLPNILHKYKDQNMEGGE